MEGIYWKKYKGVEIVYVEQACAKTDEDVRVMMDELVRQILERPEGSVLYLTDCKDFRQSPAGLKYCKNATMKIKKHLKAWAMCNNTKFQRMMIDLLKQSIGMNATLFSTREEAEEWLIKQ